MAGKRRVDQVYLVAGSAEKRLGTQLSHIQAPVEQVTAAQILAITQSPHHQGIAARVGPFPYVDLVDLIDRATGNAGPIVVLDEIQDPANLGSILRVAECLGAAGVILTKDRCVSVTPAVEKAAAGGSAHVPVARVVNLARAVEQLKKAGYWVYAAEAGNGVSLYSLVLSGKMAFVLGSEGKGIRRLVLEKCDHLVSVPMIGRISSLNVAQTASILLAESLRQRLASGEVQAGESLRQ